MSTQHFLLTAWDWNGFTLLGCLAGLAVYAALAWKRNPSPQPSPHRMRRGGVYLIAGLVICAVALVSPINVLSDGYLFSAHMLQHLLLLLIAPPLLLLSLPVQRDKAAPGALERCVTFPAVTWLAGVGAMLLWHVPSLCNAATSSPPVHGFQVFTLLILGGLFWWPICGPKASRRLSPPTGVLYLFSACVSCTLLGIYLTFAPVEVCSVYMNPPDRLGILPLIRNVWKITPSVDQEIGGLLMWVPACTTYLSVIMGMLLKWFAAGDEVVESDAAAALKSERKAS